jgi:hypothetical protein
MSESSSPADGAPRHPTETDGWFLPKDSWGFHRSAFRLLGRPLAFGEYTLLRGQITWGQAELLRFGGRDGVYRVRRVRLRRRRRHQRRQRPYPPRRSLYRCHHRSRSAGPRR